MKAMPDIVKDCLARALDKDENELCHISEDEKLEEYGLDSLYFVRLLVLIEEKFKFTFNDSDVLIENFDTLQKISDMIYKYTGDNGEQKDFI